MGYRDKELDTTYQRNHHCLQGISHFYIHQFIDFTFTFHFHALEKEMATHSSVLGLENPRDGGTWWAAVYGVAQSRTQLK